jgi:hypothetical protein
MAGRKGLAEAEALSNEMSKAMRRLLSIPRRIPDTTLRDILCRLCPNELRKVIHATIKAAWRRKALKPVGFPFNAVSMDGKGTALPAWDFLYAQRHVHEKTGALFGLLRTVTSCLVTAAGAPCIDAMPIPARTNEMGEFQHAFGELVRLYGRLFRLVIYDAGAASWDNAKAVLKAGKDYLFRLKDKRRLM